MASTGGFLGLTWDATRALRAVRAPSGSSVATLVRTDLHLVTVGWWPRGAASPIQGHGASAASLRVVEGEIVEERWTRGEDGGWVYARQKLRAGDTTELPPGALQRIAALRAASVVTTYTPPPADAIEPIAPGVVSMLESARAGMDGSTSTSVEIWAPRPEDLGDSDA